MKNTPEKPLFTSIIAHFTESKSRKFQGRTISTMDTKDEEETIMEDAKVTEPVTEKISVSVDKDYKRIELDCKKQVETSSFR